MEDCGAIAAEEPRQARRGQEYVRAVLPHPAGERDIIMRQIGQPRKRYPAYGDEENQHKAPDAREGNDRKLFGPLFQDQPEEIGGDPANQRIPAQHAQRDRDAGQPGFAGYQRQGEEDIIADHHSFFRHADDARGIVGDNPPKKEKGQHAEEERGPRAVGSEENDEGAEGKEQAGNGDPSHIDPHGDSGDIRKPHGREVNGLNAMPDSGNRIVDMAMLSGQKAFGHDLYNGKHVRVGDVDGHFIEPVEAPGIKRERCQADEDGGALDGGAAQGARA